MRLINKRGLYLSLGGVWIAKGAKFFAKDAEETTKGEKTSAIIRVLHEVQSKGISNFML
jgi:hypothetical protein